MVASGAGALTPWDRLWLQELPKLASFLFPALRLAQRANGSTFSAVLLIILAQLR